METYCISIENNATSRTKLQDLRQRIVSNCGIHHKIETISTGHHKNIGSLDRSQKSQVLSRTTQTQWKTSKMVSETARL